MATKLQRLSQKQAPSPEEVVDTFCLVVVDVEQVSTTLPPPTCVTVVRIRDRTANVWIHLIRWSKSFPVIPVTRESCKFDACSTSSGLSQIGTHLAQIAESPKLMLLVLNYFVVEKKMHSIQNHLKQCSRTLFLCVLLHYGVQYMPGSFLSQMSLWPGDSCICSNCWICRYCFWSRKSGGPFVLKRE